LSIKLTGARQQLALIAAADGNADVGLGQGRRVVDAVADHADKEPPLLVFLHHGLLPLGEQACLGVSTADIVIS
jgi:hypothetical protein